MNQILFQLTYFRFLTWGPEYSYSKLHFWVTSMLLGGQERREVCDRESRPLLTGLLGRGTPETQLEGAGQ